jgi:hypothetical protein
LLPPDRFATVVAFYGDTKPAPLAEAISGVASLFTGVLGASFQARPLHDVHATIIGLEDAGPLTPGSERNDLLNRLPPGAEQGTLDLADRLAATLDEVPLTVGFGVDNRTYPFTSRGLPLYERAVTVSGDKVVLIGWPIDGASGQPVDRLDRIRRDVQRSGVTHRYHREPGSTDPDSYLVIGELTAAPDPRELSDAVARARAMLAADPVRVPLGSAQVSLVFYEDTRLPQATTTALPLRAAPA